MNIPDHDNMIKWVKTINKYWNAAPWWKGLRLVILVIIVIILARGMPWLFIRSKSGAVLKPQYTSGRDMSVCNIENVEQLVIGTPPEDIENLRRLTVAQVFKPISNQLGNEVHTNLTDVQQKFTSFLPKIVISVDRGNQNRLKVADEMNKLLFDSGFNVVVRSSDIFTQERKPIKAIFNSRYREFVKAILMAFEPMLKGTIGLREVEDRQGEEITILILGEPRFTDKGIIVFE